MSTVAWFASSRPYSSASTTADRNPVAPHDTVTASAVRACSECCINNHSQTRHAQLQQGISHLEVLARMLALLPDRARVPETVALRLLPNATCEDIRANGLARR